MEKRKYGGKDGKEVKGGQRRWRGREGGELRDAERGKGGEKRWEGSRGGEKGRGRRKVRQ